MKPNNLHTLGIDIGSTTVKIAVLNDDKEVLFLLFRRSLPSLLLYRTTRHRLM